MRILLTIFLFISLQSIAANKYYASTSSGGTNAGTLANPFTSITSVNAHSYAAGDTIFFKRGDTFTGTITPANSGSAGNAIVYTYYGSGAAPVISGATILSSWSNVGTNLYEASLSTKPKCVTISNVQYAPARFPTSGWWNIDNTNGTSTVQSSSLSGQTGLVGASVVIRKNNSIIDKTVISAFSGTTLTTNTSGAAANSINAGYGFFLTDKASYCTYNNSWYWNSSTNKLLMYFSGSPVDVTVSTTNTLISINSKNYITFYGLTFSHANEDMVDFSDCNNITISNCTLQFAGNRFVVAGGSTNTNFTFSNNTCLNSNNDGGQFYGGSNDGLTITGNTITNIGTFVGEGGNGWGSNSAFIFENQASTNSAITYNNISNVAYSGLQGGATNMLIQYNYLYNTCMYMDDGAAIYMQSPSGTNKRILNNIVIQGGLYASQGRPSGNDAQADGIYSDDTNINTEIGYNTCKGFLGYGIYMNDGNNINWHHNTTYNNNQEAAFNVLFGGGIASLKVKRNIFFNDNASVRIGAFQDLINADPIGTWSTAANWDSNYYAKPLSNLFVIYSYPGFGSGVDYTISGWSAVYGYDSHSQNMPAFYTGSNDSLFINPTSSTINVVSTRKWKDISGSIYDGTIPLTQYQGLLLFDVGAATNLPPVANAGGNQSIAISTCTLNGTGSSDPDGTIVGYAWVKLSGTGGTIVSPTSAITNVTGLSTGTYVFQLTVTDNNGLTGSDPATITVNIPTGNNGTILIIHGRRVIIN